MEKKKWSQGSVLSNSGRRGGIPPTVGTQEISDNMDDVLSWDARADVSTVNYGLEADVSTVVYDPEADANPDNDEEDQRILKDLKDPSQIPALEY